MLVLVIHFVVVGFEHHFGWIKPAFGWTWVGVDLFFVLSGYLLGGILIDNRNSDNYFKTFYVRRICRIFPLYFGFVGLLLSLRLFSPVLAALIGLAEPAKPHQLPDWAYLCFIQNVYLGRFGFDVRNILWLGPTWSLAVEEQFYLMLPIILRFLPVKRLLWLVIAAICFSMGLRTGIFLFHPYAVTMNFFLYPCRWDSMWIGVLAAWLVRQPFFQPFAVQRRLMLGVLLHLSAIPVVLLFWEYRNLDSRASVAMAFYGYTMIAVTAALLILIAHIFPDGVIARSFCWRPLRWLGKISFAVYLFHTMILELMHSLLYGKNPSLSAAQELVVVVSALAATLLVSALSWRFFESRIIAWGHRLQYQSAGAGLLQIPDVGSCKRT